VNHASKPNPLVSILGNVGVKLHEMSNWFIIRGIAKCGSSYDPLFEGNPNSTVVRFAVAKSTCSKPYTLIVSKSIVPHLHSCIDKFLELPLSFLVIITHWDYDGTYTT
jgi:hypothetical protein